MKETVSLTAHEEGTGKTRRFELTLVAAQRQLAEAVPPGIDFGSVDPGKTYERRLRLCEEDTDRFTVTGIDANGLPLSHRIEQAIGPGGLAVYRITLSLKPEDATPRPRTGHITIKTTSINRHNILVPINFALGPRVQVLPSVVGFGTVTAGDIVARKVMFIGREKQPPGVTVVDTPRDCSVEIQKLETCTEILLKASPTIPGIWHRVIHVRTNSDPASNPIEIRCAAVVRAAS